MLESGQAVRLAAVFFVGNKVRPAPLRIPAPKVGNAAGGAMETSFSVSRTSAHKAAE